MSTPRVLLLGGHGKVAQLLTPLLIPNHHLTSVIRDPAQRSTIIALGASHQGRLDVMISNIEDIKTQSQAQKIISSTNPNYIIWSAGAGGKGGAERTFAIDRDACVAFIKAAVATESVSKFLLISYVGSRRRKAPWWDDEDWKATQEVNDGGLRNYHIAKLAADECLMTMGRTRGDAFAAIDLRPGTLTDDAGPSKVSLGKTKARGRVSRENVARVSVQLLEKGARSCWLDLLEGQQDIGEAVERCIKEGVDCIEGEDVEATAKG